MNFKRGDRVSMKDGDNGYCHGEITIVREYDCKVLWDEEWAPDYWYYPKDDLIYVEENKYDNPIK